MKAMLLAAGFGTRLKPITDTIPKCLVPIQGKPLLAYWLDSLGPIRDIEEIWINTHYLKERVEDFLAQSPWKNKVRLWHEKDLLGTAGTLKALSHFLTTNGSPVLVAHADNLCCFDPEAFLKFHLQKPESIAITMMTFETDHPRSCGILELDSNGIVVAFHEKVENPPGNLANAAVYVFDGTVFNTIQQIDKPQIDISLDILPKYLGKIQTFANPCYHRDIGSPESLAMANYEFHQKGGKDYLCKIIRR